MSDSGEMAVSRGGQSSLLRDRHGLVRKKIIVIGLVVAGTAFLAVLSMTVGSASVSAWDVLMAVFGRADPRTSQIVIHIRLLRVLAAIVTGAGVAAGGCIMQGTLRNPLASDFTLGISQGAALGAAIAIVALGAGSAGSASTDAVAISNPYTVSAAAFIGAISATTAILMLARLRGMGPETMILAGIAFTSLFSAGTVITQYFASDVQVASIVFWTFGDIGRASWKELLIMTTVIVPIITYFYLNRWNYNSLEGGDDVASSLGVNVTLVRTAGMFLAALVSSVTVAFMGIIAFVGLVSPHIMRRIIGGDYCYLIPASCAMGAFLLLAADTVSRTIVAPVIIPVGAITSFLGAPLFLYLILRGNGRL